MAWDMAISAHGDLVFAGNRDLAGVSGTDLLEQRMRLRLRVHRGSWTYDEDKTLGSFLYQVIGMPPQSASDTARIYVNEALRDMTEIVVDDVVTLPTDKDLTVIVFYRVLNPTEQPAGVVPSDQQQLTVILSIWAGGVI